MTLIILFAPSQSGGITWDEKCKMKIVDRQFVYTARALEQTRSLAGGKKLGVDQRQDPRHPPPPPNKQ